MLLLSSAFATVISVDVAHRQREQLNDTDPTLADRCVQTGFERHGICLPAARAGRCIVMAVGALARLAPAAAALGCASWRGGRWRSPC